MVNREYIGRQGEFRVPELHKFMGKRDTEQSLHLASPLGGFLLLLQARRLRSSAASCSSDESLLPAIGKQMLLQERARTLLLLSTEGLA